MFACPEPIAFQLALARTGKQACNLVRIKNTFIDDWDNCMDDEGISRDRAFRTCPNLSGFYEPEPELSPAQPPIATPAMARQVAAGMEVPHNAGLDLLLSLMEPELPRAQHQAAAPAWATHTADGTAASHNDGLDLLFRLLDRPSPEECLPHSEATSVSKEPAPEHSPEMPSCAPREESGAVVMAAGNSGPVGPQADMPGSFRELLEWEPEIPVAEEPEPPAMEARCAAAGLPLSFLDLQEYGCRGELAGGDVPADEELPSPATWPEVAECYSLEGCQASATSSSERCAMEQSRQLAAEEGEEEEAAASSAAADASSSLAAATDGAGCSSQPWPSSEGCCPAGVARKPRGGRCRSKVWCHFFLNEEMLRPGFDLNKKIIGLNGSCTKRIFDATGAKVRLRGRGSGHLEGGREAPVHLMLTVGTEKGELENFMEAFRMALDHLSDISRRFRAFCRQRRLPQPRGQCFWLGEVSAGVCEFLGPDLGGVPASKDAPGQADH